MQLISCTRPDIGPLVPPPSDDSEVVEKPDAETPGDSDTPGDAETPGDSEGPTEPVPAPSGGNIIVGYAVWWDSRMPDPTLLTHINYAFALINNDFETLDIKKTDRLRQIVALKSQNPNLKVVLSVGGWGAGNFSEMAASENHRRNFCKNCLTAVNEYGLDGIDIDWEYPTSSSAGISSSSDDKANFTLLMRDLRSALGSDKLVTIATSASAKYYDLKAIEPYLDFINIMTYDMGRPPYHNAGLYPSSMTKNSCQESVETHHQGGFPYGKLVLGIPFYGKPPTGDSVDYIDIVGGAYDKYSKRWDDVAKVPYYVDSGGTMVLSFENETSVGHKADFIRSKGLLGAMYWNIEADDNDWTLSKALASKLLTAEPSQDETSEEPADPENPSDENLETFQVTHPYMQAFMDQVDYNVDYRDKTTTLIKNFPGGGPGEADIPPSVTIKWNNNGYSDRMTLKVWDTEWSREYSLSAGTTQKELLNLVPNVRYDYKVTGRNGETVAEGAFKTTGSIHQVYFPYNVRNCRDLGGWKTLDGKTVVYRKMYRGGAVKIDDEGIEEWKALGIKADLDLREKGSASKSPAGSDMDFICPGFPSGYVKGMLDGDNVDGVRKCFVFLAECLRNNKPVFFHCSAGRDRTGTLAMLTLGLLGVKEGDLGKDYELTYFSPEDWSMSYDNGKAFYDHTRNVSTFRGACEFVWGFGGSTFAEAVENYLLHIGVTQKDINDIRTYMLK